MGHSLVRGQSTVDNQTGISSITVRYLVDPHNGGLTTLDTDTNTTATINGDTATLTFDEPLNDGDTVVVWLTVIGSTGNQTTYQLKVGLDTTRVNVSSPMFVPNGANKYTSRYAFVLLTVFALNFALLLLNQTDHHHYE
jgi:hypothetical protein